MIKSDYSAIEVGQKSLVKAALARQKFEAEILDTGKEQEIFFNPAMLKKRENFAKNIERSNLILQTSQKEVVTKKEIITQYEARWLFSNKALANNKSLR